MTDRQLLVLLEDDPIMHFSTWVVLMNIWCRDMGSQDYAVNNGLIFG